MLYLIRFDVLSPDKVSLQELRDSWHRSATAMPGSDGPSITQSFKVVGQQTIFAIADFPDNEALDEALTRLPIVEDLGSAIKIEVILVRPFDKPDGRRQAPSEELVVAGEPEASAARPEISQGANVPERTPDAPEAPSKPPEQPEASVTGMIRGLDTPGRASIEPGDLTNPAESGEKSAPTAPSNARILIHFDSRGEISLESDLVSLGRDPDNHVMVADSKASRRHALIQNKEGTYWIDDLGSQNGTRVNDDLVTERRELMNGDVIRIGDTRLVFGTVTAGTAATEEERPAQPEDPSITGLIRDLDADDKPRR